MNKSSNFILVICGFLLKSIFAGIAKMDKQFAELVNVTYGYDDRSISWMLGFALPYIDHSGCYCYFDSNHYKGKGQPKSKVDSWCKQLHEGYSCAIMDAESEGYECVPWEVDYPFFGKKSVKI